jgi:hypothetical protein
VPALVPHVKIVGRRGGEWEALGYLS